MTVWPYIAYNLVQPLSAAALPISLVKAKRRRPGYVRARLGLNPPPVQPGGLWVHALSVGEVISARPLLARIRAARPDLPIYFSTATVTGFDLAREDRAAGRADQIFIAPLDLAPAVNRVLDQLRPGGLVIVETDVWPNLLRACRRRNLTAALVNFRISLSRDRSHRLATSFFREIYSNLNLIALPGQADARRLDRLGLPASVKTAVTGSLKYDQSRPESVDPAELGLAPDQPAVVAGSTHKGEEEIILRAWSHLRPTRPDLALILAPRDKPRFDRVAKLIQRETGSAPARMSRGEGYSPDRPVILADVLGRLAGLYSLGRVAFVGGSLVNAGGHNPLEPAAWNIPVAFGRYMEDFLDEARRLLANGGGRVVQRADDLAELWAGYLNDSESVLTQGRAAGRAARFHHGAADRIMARLAEVLPCLRRA